MDIRPTFYIRAKFGLPYAFNLRGSLSTNAITFQIRTGLQWGYNIGRVTFSLNSDVAYWLGRLNSFGFNSGVNSWS